MSQKLIVNQKEYLPSAELGKKFNYSSDYISKLARDEKVLGTRVGRQWFVEPESLRTYILQLEIEKGIHQENLRRQRKIEHKQHSGQKDPLVQIHSAGGHSLMAAGQALAIVLCGALVGVLTFSAYTHGLQWQDISSGAQSTARQVTAEIFAGFSVLTESRVSEQATVANSFAAGAAQKILSEEVGPRFSLHGQYTTFPLLKQEEMASSTVIENIAVEASEGYHLPFSDDLLVEESDDELRVRPVFRDAVGELYQLSAIPVVTDGDEE